MGYKKIVTVHRYIATPEAFSSPVSRRLVASDVDGDTGEVGKDGKGMVPGGKSSWPKENNALSIGTQQSEIGFKNKIGLSYNDRRVGSGEIRLSVHRYVCEVCTNVCIYVCNVCMYI